MLSTTFPTRHHTKFLFHIVIILLICSTKTNTYELDRAYTYTYESEVHLGHGGPTLTLNKMPTTIYSTKSIVYLEVRSIRSSSIVEFAARIDKLDVSSGLLNTETVEAILNKEFVFEFEKSKGQVLDTAFEDDDLPGSIIFKKSLIDHLDYDLSKVGGLFY